MSRAPHSERSPARPLVTVVTPSFNHAPFIRETIESVLDQDYPAIEYIVMDGGSTDGTIDILEEYENRLTWCSEADRGCAHAINKGWQRARGEILHWLNSDDILLPGAVTTAVAELDRHRDAVGVYGPGLVLDPDGRVAADWPVPAVSPRDVLWINDPFLQPATFVRASAIARIGLLDERRRWVFDWDLFVRLLRDGPMVHVDQPLAAWRCHDASLTQTGGVRRLWEIYRMLFRYRVPPTAPVYQVQFVYTGIVAAERVSRRGPRWVRPMARRVHTTLARWLWTTLAGGRLTDGWASPHVRYRAGTRGTSLQIRGTLEAEAYPKLRGQALTVVVDGQRVARVHVPDGKFDLVVPLPHVTSPDSIIELHAAKAFVPHRTGVSDDRRHLAYILESLRIT